ncbi:GNAT family N-acetyltransferase [Paenibacillus sp. ACRRX]|uniref:GNAT family N-acetyltransferase n=1 Tax=Paenibacillus sp. ACRRX TaxID=2918206 RepID=UPI001EF706C4|nr:GNAT family N-acetyltransferase [Paenibacillus sp. ACRRX]MCG7407046.1 GNAT family N-acetyltransferase [Paenibacillus sp. ACRRX]
MTAAGITVEPMQAKYNLQVGRLLVYGFRGKFQHLTNLNDDDLAQFFASLLELFPAAMTTRRVIAVYEGEVIGTLSIKWNVGSIIKQEKKASASWKNFSRFSKWNAVKLFLGLWSLEHKPQVGECYIADVAVHPGHRSKGIGSMLLDWARQHAQAEPRLKLLSLHVSGKNPRARQLYEQMSFRRHSHKISVMSHVLLKEGNWYYMVQEITK